MNKVLKAIGVWCKLGILTSAMVILGSFDAGGAPVVLVNETFSAPTFDLFGWEDGSAINISRQYVYDGVEGSIAAQASAEFLPVGEWGGIGTMLLQKGDMLGNELATLQNTVLSFDV